MKPKSLDFKGRIYTVFEDEKIIEPSGKELAWRYDKDGYPIVLVAGRSVGAHKLVAMVFVPNPHNSNEGDRSGNIYDFFCKVCT